MREIATVHPRLSPVSLGAGAEASIILLRRAFHRRTLLASVARTATVAVAAISTAAPEPDVAAVLRHALTHDADRTRGLGTCDTRACPVAVTWLAEWAGPAEAKRASGL